VPGAGENGLQRSGRVGDFSGILMNVCENIIQSPLVDLCDDLARSEGWIKTVDIDDVVLTFMRQ